MINECESDRYSCSSRLPTHSAFLQHFDNSDMSTHTPTFGNSVPRHWDGAQNTGTVSGVRLHYFTADFGEPPMDRAAFGSGDEYLRGTSLYTTSFRG